MTLPWPSLEGRMMAAFGLDSDATTAVLVERHVSMAGSPSTAVRGRPLARHGVTRDSTGAVTRVVAQDLVQGPPCRGECDGNQAERTRIGDRTGGEVT